MRRRTSSLLLLFLLLSLLAAGPSANAFEDLTEAGGGRVTAVVDGDTLILETPAGATEEVRLVGIQAPKLALGRKGFRPWPLGREAKRALEDLVLGKTVTFHFGGQRRDRHGRLLAHLRTAAGLWVQKELVRQGMARVYSFADNRRALGPLFREEIEARGRARGIWAMPFYKVLDGNGSEAEGRVGSFQIVTGRVVGAARAKKTVFLNFGSDWRRDFTVRIPAKVARRMAAAGLDPLSLEGMRIRVRGWIKRWNGPMIELTHLEQVERVDGEVAPTR